MGKVKVNYMKEITPLLIFTTIVFLLIIFIGFFYYLCNLPSGCQHRGYFASTFVILPIILIFMILFEKERLNLSFDELFVRFKVKKKNVKLPLDKQISKLNNLHNDFDSITLEDATDRFCITFKEIVSKIIGGNSNATYEELMERINSSDKSVKLKHDLIRIFKFIMVSRYKENKIDDKHLKKFIDYAINLANNFNDSPKAPKKIKIPKQDEFLTPIHNLKFAKVTGIFVLALLFVTGFAFIGGSITGFSSYEITEGTSGSVTIHTIADQSVVEGHNLSITITANDTDGETITFDIGDSDPSWVSIATISGVTAGDTNATGNLTFQPASTGSIGDFNVTAIARSEDNDAASEGLVITVTENTAPSFHTDIPNMTWPEDTANTSLNLSDYFNDTENDTLTFTYSGNTNITVSIAATGVVTLTPDDNWNNSETITFTASDGIDTSDSYGVLMNVTGVYDALELSQVAISPSSPNNDSNLSCSWYTASNDSDVNITAEVYWYLNVSGAWTLNLTETDISCTQSTTCNSSETINDSETRIDNMWNCTVNVTDQNTTFINSTNITIGASAPTLNILTSDSDSFNRTPVNNTILFNFTWSDVDSTNVSVYVCNTSTANTSAGCNETTFCSVNETTNYNVSCNYTVLSTDNITTGIWIFVCDSSSCSSGNASNFYVNQNPEMYESYVNLNLQEGAVVCAGDFDDDTYYNQKSFLKFNATGLYDLDVISINNASIIINTSIVTTEWNGSITVEEITNESWVSTENYDILTGMTAGLNTNLTDINSTGNSTINVTSLVASQYGINYTNFSYIMYSPYTNGTINDSIQATTFFGLGDNDTASAYGEMRFNESPYIFVNLTKQIPNYTWNTGSVQQGPDLDDYFLDPDGYALNFTVSGNENILVSIANASHLASFTPTSGWSGTETVTFIATDASGENLTANTSLIVNAVTSESTSSPSSGGGGSSVKVVSLKLNMDDVEMYPIDAKISQLTIINDGDKDLEDISLNSLFPTISGFDANLEKNTIDKLPTKTNQTITVKFTTYLATSGEYNATITGKAIKPMDVTDSETFVIKIKEDDDESFFAKVRFIEDLFKTNPECIEYLEHVQSAKTFYYGGSFSKAHRVLDTYIKECKDRITTDINILDPLLDRSGLDRNKIMIILGVAVISMMYIASLYLHNN